MRFRGTVAFALLTGALACAGLGASAINSWNETSLSETDRPVAAEVSAILARTETPMLRASERVRAQHAASGTLIDASFFDPSPLNASRADASASQRRVGEAPQPRQAAVRAPQAKSYVVASAQPGSMPAELMPEAAEPLPSQVMAMADPNARVPVPVAAPAKSSAAQTAAARRAAEKAEKIDPNNLTVAQIARVKAMLNITPDQEVYWQPVEAALLDVAKEQAARRARGSRYAMPATDSQQLYWTAGPLIMNLRPDQKQEARNLARSLGMTTVASLI